VTGRTGAIALVLFIASFAIAGLVTLALLWSGPDPYRDMARANGIDRFVFLVLPTGRLEADLETAVALHAQWSGYVTGGRADAPSQTDGPRLWTDDEYKHMADVRGVFGTARFLVPVALFVMLIRLQRARAISPRVMWKLVRDGAVIAAVVLALVGIAATVAFEQLFLLFHYVFFPQGNFLFDPASSNLVRLYPDWYWEGISLRVGLSFIAAALGVAAIAHLRLRAAK
jgi:integral membrane protein (TIGR01906 family)